MEMLVNEGDYAYFRINFQTPGRPAGKKDETVRFISSTLWRANTSLDTQLFEDPDATSVRLVTYCLLHFFALRMLDITTALTKSQNRSRTRRNKSTNGNSKRRK